MNKASSRSSHYLTRPKRDYDGHVFAYGVSNWFIKDRRGLRLECQRGTVLPSFAAAKAWAKRHNLAIDLNEAAWSKPD